MLTQLFDRFKKPSTPPSPPPRDFRYNSFSLGKDKDGNLFADPKYLCQLDDYQEQKQAADELNGHLALLAQVRNTVLPLEGSAVDLNPREGVTAVTGYPLNDQGQSVDAVLCRQSPGYYDVDARIHDNGKIITIYEDFVYPNPNRELKFGADDRYYTIKDKNNGTVEVELRSRD